MTNKSETNPSLSSATTGVTETGGSAPVSPDATGIGIGAIAHDVGLTNDTVRVGERRYGFPQPWRAPGGEGLYPQEQVTKLRLVKRLLDAGHRPSKVLPQSITRLQPLADDSGGAQGPPDVALDRLR